MLTKKLTKVLTEYLLEEYEGFKKEEKLNGYATEKWILSKHNFEFRYASVYATVQIDNAGPFCNTGFTLDYEEVERRFKKEYRLIYMLLNI